MTIKKLTDEVRLDDPRERFLADLLHGAEPLEPNPFSKRIVYRRVVGGEQRSGRWLLRVGPVAVLLGGSAVAAAAVGGYTWLEHRNALRGPPALPAVQALEQEEHQARSRITWKALGPKDETTAPAPVTAALDAPAEPQSERTEELRSAHDAPGRHGQAAATSSRVQKQISVQAPSAAGPADSSEDPSEMAEAVRALRKEGDAARAQRLLDHYLVLHPHGAFAEDALALAIEAASARHDPRASAYAKQYLARFPAGRFGSVARRALDPAR